MIVTFLMTVMAIIAGISIITMIYSKWNSNTRISAAVILGISIFFGGLIFPIVLEYDKEYVEITNHELTYGDGKVIIDLVNSPEKKYERLYIFDRYKSVIEINDYTKFYIVKNKSFYGITITENIVWSNPPYETFNKE